MNQRVLIAGIGNIFLGDDAFGVEVAQRLAQRSLPAGVRVADFGIRSYDLAYALMDGWELVILVDAMARGEEPGTIYTLEPDAAAMREQPEMDAHTMTAESVLRLVRALEGEPARILVVGCEPAGTEADEGGAMCLSPPVEEAVEVAIRTIEEIIAGSGFAIAA